MSVKTCTHCKVAKPFSEYYDKGNGCLMAACKDCLREKARERYRNPNPKKDKPTKWSKKYPEKDSANKKLEYAVKSGKMQRKICLVDGCIEEGVGHHEDYNKPLDVDWICNAHHMEYHKIRRMFFSAPRQLINLAYKNVFVKGKQ